MDIDYLTFNVPAGANVGYQYQFESATGAWSAPSSNRTIHFASLAPGSYKLRVRAITSDGGASRQPVLVAFRVLAPFWWRWWFLALAATALALAIYAAHAYRVRQIV